jgi:hypothetical protein
VILGKHAVDIDAARTNGQIVAADQLDLESVRGLLGHDAGADDVDRLGAEAPVDDLDQLVPVLVDGVT